MLLLLCCGAVLLIGIVALVVWLAMAPGAQEPAPATVSTKPTQAPTTAPTKPSTEPTQPTQPEPPVDPEPQLTEAELKAQEIMETMTDEEKVWQLFFVTPEQLTDTPSVIYARDTTKQKLAERPVGGLIYFEHNLQNRSQAQNLIEGTQEYAKLDLFIAVDEEGGTVNRIACNQEFGVSDVGDMADVTSAEEAGEKGKTLGEYLKPLGFNLDFAPVADVWTNSENWVVKHRAFGTDAQDVAEKVKACVEGFRETGVMCTLKHFPGHGHTGEDSHQGAAVSNKTLEELQACELLPFRSGIEAGAQFVMVGHMSLPQIDADYPASLSYKIMTELLREEMGFKGIIITDAMNMGAITAYYDSAEAAVLTLKAGADMILMPQDMMAAYNGVLAEMQNDEQMRQLIEEKVMRILSVKIENGIITEETVAE